MKSRTTIVTLAVCLTAAAQCFAASPHAGTWKLNEAKSKMASEMGKNSTVVYTEEGDKMKVTVDGVDKDGKPTHSVWVGKFDGKSYPVKGNLPYNAMIYKVVSDHANHLTAMKNGKTLWTGMVTVAKDGKSRMVTVSGTDASGKNFSSRTFYDKQ